MRGRRVLSNALFVAGTALLTIPIVHRMIGFDGRFDGDSALAEPSFVGSPVAACQPDVAAPPTAVPPRAVAPSRRRASVSSGDTWGRIAIPRVGLDWVVYEGVREQDLRRGPGHVPDTAGPDAPDGNCVIAGHRDSFFRSLAKVRRGDVVLVRTADGRTASYRLESQRIVMPEEVSVMEPTRDRRLTLITCYPFGWLGDAPYRLVWNGVAAGETASEAATADSAPTETPERTASAR